eukprot:GHVS01034655.1.p1 GENE.GHVS01034655.1~~GHVS01034655.1.p1  ORF type:complete len:109 (+),score=0.81 GHVS01034655.1:133-459(+)
MFSSNMPYSCPCVMLFRFIFDILQGSTTHPRQQALLPGTPSRWSSGGGTNKHQTVSYHYCLPYLNALRYHPRLPLQVLLSCRFFHVKYQVAIIYPSPHLRLVSTSCVV